MHDLLFAGLLLQLLHRGDELLDLAVGDVERVEDLGLGDALGAGLDHQERLVGAGDDQVELQLLVALLGRVDDEVTLEFADADRADVLGDRGFGDRQRRGGAIHREDVVGVDVIHRQRHRDQLRLVVPALGEERADRPVDHARGQRRFLAGFALAAEERAGDLARGVRALLDVDGEGKEVHIAQAAEGRGNRGPSCRRPGPRPRHPPASRVCPSRRKSGCRRHPPKRGLRQTCSFNCPTSGRPVGGHLLSQNSRSLTPATRPPCARRGSRRA